MQYQNRFKAGIELVTMASPWRFPHVSREVSVSERKKGDARTSDNENTIRDPDVVEDPWSLNTLEKYPVRVIDDHINLIMVMRSRLALETNSISTPRCREPPVEVGVLRECNAILVIEMAKVPKNFCQHRGAKFASEHL
jgi:hypothetical protein